MLEALPKQKKLQVNQHLSIPDKSRLNALDEIVIFLPETTANRAWPVFPFMELLRERFKNQNHKPDKPFFTRLTNEAGTGVGLAFVDFKTNGFERLSLARKLMDHALHSQPEKIGVLAAGLDAATAARNVEALVAAAHATDFEMPSLKQKKPGRKSLKQIQIFGLGKRVDLKRTEAGAEGNNLARWLTALPGNLLTPALYKKKIASLARQHDWQLSFYDEKKLARKNAGAFLAVTQGSPERDAGIAHLRYKPSAAPKRKISLVGKGICFDTGGSNLKAATGMYGMHGDMQGSAVALGSLLALTRLNVNFQVDCWLALAQNHIGPRAYKPNDVVTASDGTSIEIVHTDAEGRMVLADTLAIAGAGKPDIIIDYATLTGACVYSLGTRYSGVFTNRNELLETLIQAGRDSGERVWPFPNDPDYDEALDSDIADIKQCAIEGGRDHILAARFLNRFVNQDSTWIHIDLSASENKGGLAHIPTGITGFGIRLTLNLLLDQKLKN